MRLGNNAKFIAIHDALSQQATKGRDEPEGGHYQNVSFDEILLAQSAQTTL